MKPESAYISVGAHDLIVKSGQMTSKRTILEKIKSLAIELERTPGRAVFEKRTGIIRSEWYGKYWRSWNDAILEAGLSPNTKQGKLSPDVVLEKFAEVTKELNRVPAMVDLRMYAKNNTGFPTHSTFTRAFGGKSGLMNAFANWLNENPQHSDLIELLPKLAVSQIGYQSAINEGIVYLLKSGEFYKIGRSDDIERRVKQIATSLPEKLTLIHSIRTDDTSGIEAYWHRRFDEQRANGEWFQLSQSDIRAFKRRKFQ